MTVPKHPFVRNADLWQSPPQVEQPRTATNVVNLRASGTLSTGNRRLEVLQTDGFWLHQFARGQLLQLTASVQRRIIEGNVLVDRDRLIAHYERPFFTEWGWWLGSSHARNRFTRLLYRGTVGAGIQRRGEQGSRFSVGLFKEVERWALDPQDMRSSAHQRDWRAVMQWDYVHTFLEKNQAKAGMQNGAQLVIGTKWVWNQSLSVAADWRGYADIFIRLPIANTKIAFRPSYALEIDARPLPGIAALDQTYQMALEIQF